MGWGVGGGEAVGERAAGKLPSGTDLHPASGPSGAIMGEGLGRLLSQNPVCFHTASPPMAISPAEPNESSNAGRWPIPAGLLG